ncbi:hypothetical protein EBB07_33670 [Paenibacillaceae bacterium]|nr:hypothetical protein EBB07_33670 [Paenibacillaceae bacterium]
MNIIIKETGKNEVLELIDLRSGTNYIVDLIGMYDSLGPGDHQFLYDDEEGLYVCTHDTYDWWAKVVSDQSALNDRIAELKETYDSEVIHDIVSGASDGDLEDQAAAINAALDDWLEEQAELPEYIGAVTFARMLGTSQQNVSKSATRAIKTSYRGTFLKPDAIVDGTPVWLRSRAEGYANAQE